MEGNTLKTGKKYVKDLFSPESFYNIPDYQRPYVWASDQIKTLLDDIYDAYSADSKKEYFLGCMVWNTKTVDLGSVTYESQDILDGQQRFITLYLFQAVLRDTCSSSALKNKIKSRLRQEACEYDGIPERNRIEFDIRGDQDFLNKFVLTSKGTQKEAELKRISNDKRSDTSIKNMANAIIFIREWLENLMKSCDNQNFLDSYYAYLSSKVMIMFLSTPNNLDDAYNLFTVLNSRGVKLQAGDILKAQTLRQIPDEGLRKDYAKKWEKYESNIDAPYESFDEFLWSIVFSKIKQRSDINTNLNKAFNFMHDQKILQRGIEVFNIIERYYTHFTEIKSENAGAEICGCFFSNLSNILSKVHGSSYLTPLMYYRDRFGDAGIEEFLIKFDNLLSVYWLSNIRNFQPRMFAVMREIDRSLEKYKEPDSARRAFIDSPVLGYEYSNNLSDVVELPHFLDTLDKESWGNFSGTKINKTRYLLLKLDLLSGSLQSRLSFDTSTISVEHLLPRDPKYVQDVSEEAHEQWLHRLGNVVLLDRKKNSALANKAFEEKKKKYKGTIENRPNTNYVFMSYETWNLEAIQENHRRVLDILKRYYVGNSLKTVKQMLN